MFTIIHSSNLTNKQLKRSTTEKYAGQLATRLRMFLSKDMI